MNVKALNPLTSADSAIASLQGIGREFHARGWSLGTSSNFSVLISREPFRLLVTASGMDKGNLGEQDFVVVDERAQPASPDHPRSSAETWLHVVAASQPGIGAVLHTHSVWATILSDIHGDAGGFWISGYEMLKGLAGITTHTHRQWVPVFENTQDIPSLASQVRRQFEKPDHPPFHGFLIRRHGLYTWGQDLPSARRHVEILEFLLECIGRTGSYLSNR